MVGRIKKIGGFNPFEKYDRQIGSSSPRVRDENKIYLKSSPSFSLKQALLKKPCELGVGV